MEHGTGPTVVPPTATDPTPPAPAPLELDIPAHLADVLATIRFVESGGRYDTPPNRGNASGAYQYIASTWNLHGGYPHAYLAPPIVQDARALADVQAILERWKGDVSMVPVIWYYPKAAAEPALMDVVPMPQAGNRLTVREYQHRWLDVYAYVSGNPVRYGAEAILPAPADLIGRPPELALLQPTLSEIAYPVLGRSVIAPPRACDVCDGGTEAVVYGQKLQPVLAVVDGVVTARQLDDPVSGAVTLSITDRRGNAFHYSGFNDDTPDTDDGAADEAFRFTALATLGATVWAGQIIGFMGDTDPMPAMEHLGVGGEPVWPHIRVRATDPTGAPLDADALVVAAQSRQACHVAIGPWSVPADEHPAAARDDVVVSASLDGGWTLHADGTVTAIGRSALIVPPADCVWAPREPFGPGEAGDRPEDGWGETFSIRAQHWVRGVLTSELDPLVAPLRR